MDPCRRDQLQQLSLGSGEPSGGQGARHRAARGVVQRLAGGGQGLAFEHRNGDGREGFALHRTLGDEFDFHGLSWDGARRRTYIDTAIADHPSFGDVLSVPSSGD